MTDWKDNGFLISTDKEKLDIDMIYHFLSFDSYWAKGRPKEMVKKSVDNSLLCFGIYKEEDDGSIEQVGFARVVTDLTTFAYLCDVFVLPSYRGLGLSKSLLHIITNHPEIKNLSRFVLVTFDAHNLYAKYGFEPLEKPELYMHIQGKKKKLQHE